MTSKKTPPIGFGREEDSDPNGTGDGFKWGSQEGGEEQQPEEKPARSPMVVPVFVGQMEAMEILAAYDIFPLTPLSNAEQQLIQVVAALEKELGKHTLA